MIVAPFAIDAQRAALLVIDLQNDFVRDGAPQEVPAARASLPIVSRLLRSCRTHEVPVIFTRYTAGPASTHHAWFSPECRPPTKSCWRGVWRTYRDLGEPRLGHDVVDEVVPAEHELVVDKYGYGSFSGTALEDALRAASVSQVWMVGTVTQICVEETAREGFRRGFEVVVAEDAVSSFDPEMHRSTLKNLGQKFALVRPTDELLAAVERRAA